MVSRPPPPARHLRHLGRRCRGGAPASSTHAVWAWKRPARIDAISTVTPTFPNTVSSTCPRSPPTPALRRRARAHCQASRSATRRTRRRASIRPTSTAEVYTHDRTRARLDGGPRLLQARVRPRRCSTGDTTPRRPDPRQPEGGLPASARRSRRRRLAQVCEVTWQLRGQATGRQVEGARVGITANQGLRARLVGS